MYNRCMSENPEEKTIETTPEQVVASSDNAAELRAQAPSEVTAILPGAALVEVPTPAVEEFPVTHKADKINPPLTMEEKKKVWTKRIIGAIVFFAVLGSITLLVAAHAVSFLFKTILTP